MFLTDKLGDWEAARINLLKAMLGHVRLKILLVTETNRGQKIVPSSDSRVHISRR